MQISTHSPPHFPVNAVKFEPQPPFEVAALKQAPPFRYVDDIFEGSPNAKTLAGWVELKASEARYFDPALSNVLLIEALAQLSGIIIRRETGLSFGGLLIGVETAAFAPYQPKRSGILLHVEIVEANLPLFRMSAGAYQNGETLCRCTLSTRVNLGEVQ